MFRKGALKSTRIAIRLSPEDQQKIENARRAKGYANASIFIRTAINNEIGQRTEFVHVGQKIAASFDRISREIFRLGRAQQALFALLDTLAKTILTCVPEPPADTLLESIARAKSRYDRLMKSVGKSMESESRFAMEDLIDGKRD